MNLKYLLSIIISIIFYSINLFSNDYLLDSSLAFNGTIKTIVTYNGINYVGGSFTKISNVTGFGTIVDDNLGNYQTDFPKINGRVNVAIPDGNGGYYIGGEFTKVGSLTRNRLAHINSSGEVTSFAPSVDLGNYPFVYDLLLYNNKLYVVGSFNGINGITRNYAACLDLNGNLTDWNPDFNDEVYTIAIFNNILYTGGNFTQVSNTERYFTAALDLNGNLLSWYPLLNNKVKDITISNGLIYLAGSFTKVNGLTYNRVCAIRPNGQIGSFIANINNTVESIKVFNNRVIIGGRFTKINNIIRNFLAELDTNGNLSSWNPDANGSVFNLEVNNNGIYISGAFTLINNVDRSNFAKFDLNGNLTNWNPSANSTGLAIGLGSSNIFIGGLFNGLGGYNRKYIAAIDTLGNVLNWNPSPNNEVYSIFVRDTIIYFSGIFTSVNSQNISRFAGVNYLTGNIINSTPTFNGSVYALINYNDRIIVAGSFTKVNNVNRKYIAAFDLNGNLLNFAPDVNSLIFAMDNDGPNLYIGGFFTSINGQTRNNLACIDTSGVLKSFNPNVNDAVLTLKFFKNRIFIGGWFTSVSNQPRSFFACINKDGSLNSLSPNPNNAVWSLLTFSKPFDVLYLGGDFTQIFGQNVSNLAAVDINGSLVPWTPNPDKSVYALSSSNTQVFAGGLFLSLGNTLSPNFAIITTYTINPGKPSLISPLDNSIKIPVKSRFDWTSTEYTSNYRVQFSTNSSFTSIVLDTIVDLNYLELNYVKLLYDTKHFWRVRSLNLDGQSPWSDIWSFTTRIAPPPVPELLAPINESTDIGLDQLFEWSSVSTAEKYQINFSNSIDFTNIILNDSNVITNSRNIYDLNVNPLTDYFWRVRGVNESGHGEWSDIWKFTTAEFFVIHINLKTGWNLISSNLLPLNDSLENIFKNIIDKILIVKNASGSVYIPQYQINTIGKWKPKQAYYVYSTQNIILQFLGYRINPNDYTYNLINGWNTISYIRNTDLNIVNALKSLTDHNKLVIAKDGNGNVYIPEFGINTIGNMQIGKGYNLFLNSNFNFTYPEND